MERQVERRRHKVEQYRLRLRLHDPERQLNEKRKRLADLEERLQSVLEYKVIEARHRLALAGGRLHGLSPLEKISKGYGFLTDAGERRIEHIREVNPDDEITIRISDGRIRALVTGVESLE